VVSYRWSVHTGEPNSGRIYISIGARVVIRDAELTALTLSEKSCTRDLFIRLRGWHGGGENDLANLRGRRSRRVRNVLGQHLGGRKVESTPRRRWCPSQHLGGREVESTPRRRWCPSQHLGGRKVESTPRRERCPSQHLGGRKVESTPRPECSGFRVSTSKCREVGLALESAPRALGRGRRSRLPKRVGLYTPERPMVRPGSVCGARLFVRCGMRQHRCVRTPAGTCAGGVHTYRGYGG